MKKQIDAPVSQLVRDLESRGLLNLGVRYTRGPIRFDAGLFFGLTSFDPTVGFSTGFTYVVHAFNVP